MTANHGGVAALWYSCPADNVNTPDGYKASDWKILTPIKTSYPENKRNGVAFSSKMPDWYGWVGGVCNGKYDGGVLQECDDCQLAYGGLETIKKWQAQKPPTGAPIGPGQEALLINIEYELPADFECEHAVFSWLWQTPHLCLPKEVHEKGAEMDFWGSCKTDNFIGAVCSTEWEGEVFCNCIDAEVSGAITENNTTSTSGTNPSPSTPSQTLSPLVNTCAPIGDCGFQDWCDQSTFTTWCHDEGIKGSCPPVFCQELAASAPASTPTSAPWPKPVAPPSTLPGDSLICPNTDYSQCGGQGFVGDTCCPLGTWCELLNDWWSQCTPCDVKWSANCPAVMLQTHTEQVPLLRSRKKRTFLTSGGVALTQMTSAVNRREPVCEMDEVDESALVES